MRHGRRDANHAEIRDALRDVGWTVQDLGDVGKGCPDLLVGAGGVNVLLEVKSDGGKLTDDERLFVDTWRGPVFVVYSVGDAVEAVTGVMRRG